MKSILLLHTKALYGSTLHQNVHHHINYNLYNFSVNTITILTIKAMSRQHISFIFNNSRYKKLALILLCNSDNNHFWIHILKTSTHAQTHTHTVLPWNIRGNERGMVDTKQPCTNTLQPQILVWNYLVYFFFFLPLLLPSSMKVWHPDLWYVLCDHVVLINNENSLSWIHLTNSDDIPHSSRITKSVFPFFPVAS